MLSDIVRKLRQCLLQYSSPIVCIREEALAKVLSLICKVDSDPTSCGALALALSTLGNDIIINVASSLGRSVDGDSRISDDLLALSVLEVQRGARVIQAVMSVTHHYVASTFSLKMAVELNKVSCSVILPRQYSIHTSLCNYSSALAAQRL
jgi:hypothetical protein